MILLDLYDAMPAADRSFVNHVAAELYHGTPAYLDASGDGA